MKYLLTIGLLVPVLVWGQAPKVPSKMEFADIKLKSTEHARREIQSEVDALTSSATFFNIKAERAALYMPIVERIFAEAPQVEAINTTMLEQFGPKRDALQALEKEITKMQENYKRNELVMTEDKLKELKKEIIGKIQKLKQKAIRLISQITEKNRVKLARLARKYMRMSRDCRKERVQLFSRYKKELLDNAQDDRLDPDQTFEHRLKRR